MKIKKWLLGVALIGTLGAFGLSSQAKASEKVLKTTVQKVEVYKDSSLEKSKTGKHGSVYEIIGQTKIKGKSYDKAYVDSKFVGYIQSDKLRALKGVRDERKVKITKKGYRLWTNFFWTSDHGTAKKGDVYQAKMRFQIGNGKNFYSLYDKKGKFVGFINANGTDEKDVWTTSSAIIFFKRLYKHHQKEIDKYIDVKDFEYRRWEPMKNDGNVIVLRYTGSWGRRYYVKMIASSNNVIVFISKGFDQHLKKPLVKMTVNMTTLKRIK